MSKSFKYFLLSVLFWVIVDYTTVFNPDFQRWVAHMPLIWAFYLGSPFIFSRLIYKYYWQGKKLFSVVLVCMIFCELVLFQNTLLHTFPIMLIMIPTAIGIYTFITYVPMWIVEGSLKKNKPWTILLSLIWLLVALLNYATNTATLKITH